MNYRTNMAAPVVLTNRLYELSYKHGITNPINVQVVRSFIQKQSNRYPYTKILYDLSYKTIKISIKSGSVCTNKHTSA